MVGVPLLFMPSPGIASAIDSPSQQLRSRLSGEKSAYHPLVIFYNIYIPPNNINNGLRIVSEQLQMRSESSSVARVPLYYTLIGAIQETSLPKCENCHQIQAVEEGDEVLTLQAMWEYCNSTIHSEISEASVTPRVVYIHTKGSYTPSQNNEVLRRALSKAAFSSECTERRNSSADECDVCSAHFSLLPFPHVVGNIFVADCTYVSRLIPPKDFPLAKRKLHERVLSASNSELGYHEPADLRWQLEHPSWVGLDRYAMEHWIHSHPSVRPCDVFRIPFDYKRPLVQWRQLTPKRLAAPAVSDTDMSKIASKYHPWFLLPGRLYEYQALYNETPTNSSWVYRSYPTSPPAG